MTCSLASWPVIYSRKLIHAVLIYRNKDYKIRKLDSRSTSHYLHSVNMIMSCCCCLFVCFEFCLGTWWCMSSLDKKDQKTGRFFMTTMRPGDLVGNRGGYNHEHRLWGFWICWCVDRKEVKSCWKLTSFQLKNNGDNYFIDQ